MRRIGDKLTPASRQQETAENDPVHGQSRRTFLRNGVRGVFAICLAANQARGESDDPHGRNGGDDGIPLDLVFSKDVLDTLSPESQRFQYPRPIDLTAADAQEWDRAHRDYTAKKSVNYQDHEVYPISRLSNGIDGLVKNTDQHAHICGLRDMVAAYLMRDKTDDLSIYNTQFNELYRYAMQSNDPLVRGWMAMAARARGQYDNRLVDPHIVAFLTHLLDTDDAWSAEHPENPHRPLDSYGNDAGCAMALLSLDENDGHSSLPVLLRALRGPQNIALSAASALLHTRAGKPALVACLWDTQTPLQRRLDILHVLCTQMCDDESLPLFINLLADADHHIRAAAAQALGEKGCAAHEAVSTLIRMMISDTHAFPRICARSALADIAPNDQHMKDAFRQYDVWFAGKKTGAR